MVVSIVDVHVLHVRTYVCMVRTYMRKHLTFCGHGTGTSMYYIRMYLQCGVRFAALESNIYNT